MSKVETITRTMRVYDNDTDPIDICIDFGFPIDPVMYFEIEQDKSISVSIKGLEAILEAAKKLESEYRGNLK